VIGLALRLTNHALGVEYQGWPHAIAVEMRAQAQDPIALARAAETEISIAELSGVPAWDLKGDPSGRAEAVMALVAALGSRAYGEARSILEQHSALLDSDAEWASFPLLATACAGDVQGVELLLAHKARLDASDDLGMTALHWSAAYGLKAVASLLLRRGANSESLSVLLVTPGELALLNAHSGLSRELGTRISIRDIGFAIVKRMGRP
jgi:hypothetical protein